MSNYTVVEYTTKKDKKYYIQVYLRKDRYKKIILEVYRKHY